MFLQGSDLLHACNGTRSTLLAVIFRRVSLYSRERREKRRVLTREVRLTQDIYPMYSQSSKARKNNKGASLGGKCQLKKM